MQEADSILFLGMFDKQMLSLEEKVINLQEKDPKRYTKIKFNNNSNPDVVKREIDGYDAIAWIPIGDVKPTFLLKNLITEAKIILLTFNLNDQNSIEFLKEGWGHIINKSDTKSKPINQIRILIGTGEKNKINREKLNREILRIKKNFQVDYYYEDKVKKTQIKNKEIELITITDDITDFLKTKLTKKTVENVYFKSIIEPEIESDDIIRSNLDNYSHDFFGIQPIGQLATIPYYHNMRPFSFASQRHGFSRRNITASKYSNFDGNHYGHFERVREINDVNRIETEKKIDKKEEEEEIPEIINDENFVFKISNKKKTAKIIELKTVSNKITIPQVVEHNNQEYPVIEISDKTFSNCSKLWEFEYISSVENIFRFGNFCFLNADELIKISIDCVDVIIENGVFSNCKKLRVFSVKASKNIHFGENVFIGCLSLKKISVVSSEKISLANNSFNDANEIWKIDFSCDELEIGSNCFKNCIKLQSVSFEKVKKLTIGESAFSGCNNIELLLIKASEKINLSNNCFNELQNLQNLEISGEIVQIGENCFNNCQRISELLFININDLKIGKKAFFKCNCLKELEITATNILTIDEFCFSQSKSLQSVKITCNDNLKICQNCFEKCSSLKLFSSTITNKVELCMDPFKECNSLEKVFIHSNLIELSNNFINNCSSLTALIIKSNDPIEITKNLIQNCLFLKTIKIKCNNTLKILESSFSNLNHLEFLYLYGSEIYIDDNCFKNCFSIKKLDCNQFNFNSNNNLSSYFENRYYFRFLKRVEIHSESNVMIGTNCFNDCRFLDHAEFSGKNIIIKKESFKDCESLISLKIPNTSKLTIGGFCFNNCKKLNVVSIRSIDNANIDLTSFGQSVKISDVKARSKYKRISSK